MKKEVLVKLHKDFESIVKTDPESGLEFWCAREIQELLGYTNWQNFVRVIEKAKTSCATAGYAVSDHFIDADKMVQIGSGVRRSIGDVVLTRYACYLIAQNGDPVKEPIAFAQTVVGAFEKRIQPVGMGVNSRHRPPCRSLTDTGKCRSSRRSTLEPICIPPIWPCNMRAAIGYSAALGDRRKADRRLNKSSREDI
jgi:hypothetical protein